MAEPWSNGGPINILITVYSRFGVLNELAAEIGAGARTVPDVEVHLLPIDDLPLDELRPGETPTERAERRAILLRRLAAADALVVGTPAYFGSVASTVKRFFEDVLTA